MDELVVDGEKYISSKRAARLSGYTKDYIGQLCRAGKIPSKMVGRNWYVKESALKEHRKEYQGEPVVDTGLWEEGPQGSTFKGFGGASAVPPKPRLTEEHIKISYEPDPRPLIPTVSPRATSIAAQPEIPREQVLSTSKPVPEETHQHEDVSHEVPVAVSPRGTMRETRAYKPPPPSLKEGDEDDDVVVIASSSPRKNRILEIALVALVLICGSLLLFEKEDIFAVNRAGVLEHESSRIGFWNVGRDVRRLWSE